jgi:hypothetical protein
MVRFKQLIRLMRYNRLKAKVFKVSTTFFMTYCDYVSYPLSYFGEHVVRTL